MRRLLLTGVGLVLVLYLLPVFYPSETDKTERQAPTESVTAQQPDGLTITVLVNGKAQEMPLETLCGRRDGGRDCGRFSG